MHIGHWVISDIYILQAIPDTVVIKEEHRYTYYLNYHNGEMGPMPLEVWTGNTVMAHMNITEIVWNTRTKNVLFMLSPSIRANGILFQYFHLSIY